MRQRKILIDSDKEFIQENIGMRADKLALRLKLPKDIVQEYKKHYKATNEKAMLTTLCPITGWPVSSFK